MTQYMERVSPVAKATTTLLSSSVFFAAFSALMHTRQHGISYVCLSVSMTFGFLALLKIVNNVSSPFFFSRFVHWVHAMCFEVLAFVAVIVLRLFHGLFRTNLRPKPSDGKPILLVHGYVNNSSVWTYMIRRLQQGTNHSIYTIDLGRPFHSIHKHVEKVMQKIAQICQETGHKEVILIGHSMGGLVSSMAAVKIPEQVSHVFTIGTPLQGTCVARMGIGANAREMQRKSEFVQDLDARMSHAEKLQFYHIGTKTDQLVIPSSSALRGLCADKEYMFADIGHASLLFSPRVANLLVYWLSQV